MNFLVRLFRRETSSNEFIPEIDGLRFLAIALVVLCHTSLMVSENSASLAFNGNSFIDNDIPNVLLFGYQGVQLFFVISGFILAVPFMRFYLGISDRKVSLRKYFLRRLTRLEPPYILSLIIFFFIALYFGGKALSLLVPSFFASLFYLHNFIYPGVSPFINGVTWSLEIEIQYYILAPLIVCSLCSVNDKIRRRLLTVLLIGIFAVAGWLIEVFFEIKTTSLASYLQYFLCGILLCDLFLTENWESKRVDNFFIFIAGLILLLLIIGTEHAKSQNLALRIASPFLIFGFYYIVFRHAWWRRVFRLNALTLIGGMCYTIYLLHYWIVSAVSRRIANPLYFGEYDLYFLVQAAVILFAVLSISAVYFLLIEKPCMKRDWPQKLYARLRSKSLTTGAVSRSEIIGLPTNKEL